MNDYNSSCRQCKKSRRRLLAGRTKKSYKRIKKVKKRERERLFFALESRPSRAALYRGSPLRESLLKCITITIIIIIVRPPRAAV